MICRLRCQNVRRRLHRSALAEKSTRLDGTNEIVIYDVEAHEPLTDTRWSKELARCAIDDIVTAAAASMIKRPFRLHPDDAGEADNDESKFGASIYFGAAGVALSLHRLANMGFARVPAVELARSAGALLADIDGHASDPRWLQSSYMLGPLGIATIAALVSGDPLACDLAARELARPFTETANELFVGATGRLAAAHSLAARFPTDLRWAEHVQRIATALFNAWSEKRRDVWLWDQIIYDRPTDPYIGPAHGFVGNIAMLLDALTTDDPRRSDVEQRAISTLSALALRSGDLVNWPVTYGPPSTHAPLQWCHGAPGIICTLSSISQGVDATLDELLLRAGETVWAAGPLRKGSGLCHGTAGNGFAFLKLFRRTGDECWLARARHFAMHATQQLKLEKMAFGMPWNSLWTGHLGVALYLAACIEGDDRMPPFDDLTGTPNPANASPVVQGTMKAPGLAAVDAAKAGDRRDAAYPPQSGAEVAKGKRPTTR
jgi:hypothetical protein